MSWGPKDFHNRPIFGLGGTLGLILTACCLVTLLWVLLVGDGNRPAVWHGHRDIQEVVVCPSAYALGGLEKDWARASETWEAVGHPRLPDLLFTDRCPSEPIQGVIMIKSCSETGSRCKPGTNGGTALFGPDYNKGFIFLSHERGPATLAHEVGHAIYGYAFMDEKEHATYPRNLMNKAAREVDEFGRPTLRHWDMRGLHYPADTDN